MARTLSTPTEGKKGFFGNLADFFATSGAYGVSKVGQAAANVAGMTDIINPVSWAQKATEKITVREQKTFGEGAKEVLTTVAQAPVKVQEKLGTTQSKGGGIGKTFGEISGTIAATVPAMSGAASAYGALKAAPALAKTATAAPKLAQAGEATVELIKKHPVLAKTADFITKSLGTTTVSKGVDRGELPTAKEIGAYGLLDVALLGVATAGRGVYRGAFKGRSGEEKNMLRAYEKTVADTAEKLGYSGSERDIIKQATEGKRNFWSSIKEAASQSKPVKREQFLKIADQLVEPYKGLPNSEAKSAIMDSIQEVVKKNAPTISATGDEIVEIITNINKELFGDGAKTVLSLKQLNSIEKGLKDELKNLLPKGVGKLYEGYAMNKMIEEVMRNEEVKRYIGRKALAGSSAGAAVGGASLARGDDWVEAVVKALAAAAAGALGGAASANTALATVGGKTAQIAGKSPATSVLAKDIIEALREPTDGIENK